MKLERLIKYYTTLDRCHKFANPDLHLYLFSFLSLSLSHQVLHLASSTFCHENLLKNTAKSKIPVRLVKNVISKWRNMNFPGFLSFWFKAVTVLNPPDQKLKPLAGNNKARRSKFHWYVGQFLPRDHGGFGHKNQKMSDILGIAQKVRHFLILVPKPPKIVVGKNCQEVDGTKCG